MRIEYINIVNATNKIKKFFDNIVANVLIWMQGVGLVRCNLGYVMFFGGEWAELWAF